MDHSTNDAEREPLDASIPDTIFVLGIEGHTSSTSEELVRSQARLSALVVSQQAMLQELRSSQAARMESEERLRAITESTRTVMFMKDLEGRYLHANHAFEDLFHFSNQSDVGKTDFDLFSKAVAQTVRKNDQWVIATGRSLEAEEDIPHDDGMHTYLSEKVPVRDVHGKIFAVCGIATDITERKNAEDALRQLNQALEDKKVQLRELVAQNQAVRESERKHIAREVHDELAQVLTALRMDTSFIAMRFGALDPALNAKVLGMRALVDNAIQGVRNVASNLRPMALDMGLYLALDWLRQDFVKRTGIACTLDAKDQNVLLDEARSIVVFRIVQESLTNISRYAAASQVFITLDSGADQLGVEVHDDGRGFDPVAAEKAKTFGLLGMRERALALGGLLEVVSSPGQGTTIGLTIPMERRTLDGTAR